MTYYYTPYSAHKSLAMKEKVHAVSHVNICYREVPCLFDCPVKSLPFKALSPGVYLQLIKDT